MRNHTEGSSDPSAPVGADEVHDLRRRVRELEEAVRRLSEAPRSGTPRKFRSARSRLVGIGAAALLLALAGGSAVVAQSGFQGLFVDKNGNVGIGTAEPGDNKLRVNGSVEIGGANPIRFTPQWSDFSSPAPNHRTNTAEISNDTSSFKALMVVGNSSARADRRQVQIFDDLTLPSGSLTANDVTARGTVTAENVTVRGLSAGNLTAGNIDSPNGQVSLSKPLLVKDRINIGDQTVPVASTPLRLVAGTVSIDGSLRWGAGLFSVRKLEGGGDCHGTKGRFEIRFAKRFSAVPAASVTQVNENDGAWTSDNAIITALTPEVLVVKTGNGTPCDEHRPFSFIVMGPDTTGASAGVVGVPYRP
jgi:hypothetical protein